MFGNQNCVIQNHLSKVFSSGSCYFCCSPSLTFFKLKYRARSDFPSFFLQCHENDINRKTFEDIHNIQYEKTWEMYLIIYFYRTFRVSLEEKAELANIHRYLQRAKNLPRWFRLRRFISQFSDEVLMNKLTVHFSYLREKIISSENTYYVHAYIPIHTVLTCFHLNQKLYNSIREYQATSIVE